MKKFSLGVLSLLAGVLLLTSPVLAGGTKSHSSSCKQIRAALAKGKSADEVASQFNVSTDHVNQCTKKVAKKSSHSHPKAKE